MNIRDDPHVTRTIPTQEYVLCVFLAAARRFDKDSDASGLKITLICSKRRWSAWLPANTRLRKDTVRRSNGPMEKRVKKVRPAATKAGSSRRQAMNERTAMRTKRRTFNAQ